MSSFRILAKGQERDNDTWVSGLNNNDVIIGPSGAGKTRYYVKPNMMQCNESMIIADTKGNLHQQVGNLLEEEGYQLQVINFKNVSESVGYNPLDYVRIHPNTRTHSEQDIISMAESLVPDGNHKDPFWDQAARGYLVFLLAYTLETSPKKDLHLGTVMEHFSTLNRGKMKDVMGRYKKENPDSFAVRQYKAFAGNDKVEKMNQSILGILGLALAPLTFSALRTFYTKTEKVDIQKISEKKTAVFLIISDTDRSMDNFCNIFYKQALQILCDVADSNADSRLKVPVRFILDDFATNTVIPDFDNLISVIRSREISVSIILQSITQLYGLYGSDKGKTILNNCDNCLYLGGQDVETADYIAIKANVSIHEILEMPLNKAYLFTRGSAGKIVERYDIKSHPNYHRLTERKKVEQKEEVSRFARRTRLSKEV